MNVDKKLKKIFKLVLKIGDLKKQGKTNADVFLDYHSHVDYITIQIYSNGWGENTSLTFKMDKRLHDENNSRLKKEPKICTSIMNEIIANTESGGDLLV